MDVDIDSLIEDAENWLKELEHSGELWHSLVLLCAIKLFKEQKAKEIRAVQREIKRQAKTQSVNVTPERSQEYHQNPDGSWEGFLDADTANKMIRQGLDRGVLAAQKAFQKKDEMIREAIQNERESAENSGTIRTDK